MNRSDERMNAFSFKGIWAHYALREEHLFHFTWIDRISPRGVVEWFDFHEGIGLSDQGYQPDGSEADYFENVDSDGLAMLGYLGRYKNLSLTFYQWYLDNLSYTSWLGLEYDKDNWNFGLQYALQFTDGHQRELPYEQRYVQPGENGQVLSGQVRYQYGDWNLRAAFSQAFDSGRFLFPRELGRDQFYTSLPRSRLEGFGDTRILTLGGEYHLKRSGLTAGLDWTRLWGPETGTYTFNKYDLDAYWQVNARLHYSFSNFMDGLSIDFLYVYKENSNDTRPETIFNRSNYHQFNLVTTFVFN
jgi:predicted porin